MFIDSRSNESTRHNCFQNVYTEVIGMKTYNLIRKTLYWIGLLFFLFGVGTMLGPLDYNSFIPNKSTALIFTGIGIAVLLISNFFKKPKTRKN